MVSLPVRPLIDAIQDLLPEFEEVAVGPDAFKLEDQAGRSIEIFHWADTHSHNTGNNSPTILITCSLSNGKKWNEEMFGDADSNTRPIAEKIRSELS